MDILSSLTILAGLLLYTSVSKRIENSPLTGPILFVSFGYVFGPDALNFIRIDLNSELVKMLAELTLVFVLFSDSSRINITELRTHSGLPVRLLGIALPLTIIAGFGAALLLFGELNLWEAALIAIIVAPTDAALGQAVVTSVRVPKAIRGALNVKSGLNDGFCVPALDSCILAAVVATGLAAGDTQPGPPTLLAQALGLGVLVGFGVSFLAARYLAVATRHDWVETRWSTVGLLADNWWKVVMQWDQEWRVGSATPGKGVLVQTNLIQKRLGLGVRLPATIFSPVAP